MAVIEMPDGNHVDIGENPSPEMKAALAKKYQDLSEAKASGAPLAPPPEPAAPAEEGYVSKYGPSAVRAVGAVGGGVAGTLVGGPGLGTAAGAAAGGVAGDYAAQQWEIAQGKRKAYNPVRGAVEGVTNAAFAGIPGATTISAFADVPMGTAITAAVATAGTLGVVSSNAISMSEGQGLNDAGQNSIAFLTAGGLQAITGHYEGVRAKAVQEISGVPQIEEHVNILTKPDAPTHGPDGVPTEIPAPTLLDEFGRPVSRQAEYPIKAGEPGYIHQELKRLEAEDQGPGGANAKPGDSVVHDGQSATVKEHWTGSDGIARTDIDRADGRQLSVRTADLEIPTTTGGGEKAGQTPVKRDTGLSLSSRKGQAKQAVLDTWIEQRRPGIFEAQPSKDIPPLESITPEQPLLEPDGGMEDLIQQGNAPIHDIPGNGDLHDPSPVTQQGIMRYVGRTKGYFIRLEKETGYPVYQDYDQLSQANRKYQTVRNQMSSTAGKALKGSGREDWNAIIQDAAAGTDGQSLKPGLRSKAQTVMSVADRALEPFGITSHDLFSEYLPAVVSNDQDVLAQEKFAKFQDGMIQGKVNLETSDLPRMMQQLTNMGAHESELGPTIANLKEKYSANQDVPEPIKQAVNFYTSVLDGTPDRISTALGASITHIGGKFGWTIDGQGIANRMVSTQYSAMLAGRPGPIIRRLLHPIQTAVGPMGMSWLAEGYRQFLTKEGRAAIEASGVSSENIMNELAAGGKTGVGRVVDKAVSVLMTPFGSADLASRGPVYLGARAKILWAAEKYGDNMDKFLTKSGVGRYSQPEANIVLGLLNKGDAAGAADRGAQMLVDNTQFMYSQLERPRVFTGMGKTLGAFGVWPAQYGEYLANMANPGANGTWYEVGRDYARFLTANAAIVGGFYGAAKFVNDKTQLTDTLGWSMVSHAIYSGAPGMSAILAGANQLKELSEGRGIPKNKAQAKTKGMELFRTVGAPFVPMSGMGLDILRARKEPTPLRGVSTYAGITRGPAPKSKGALTAYGAGKPLKGF